MPVAATARPASWVSHSTAEWLCFRLDFKQGSIPKPAYDFLSPGAKAGQTALSNRGTNRKLA